MNTLTEQDSNEMNQKRAEKSSENRGAAKPTMMRGLGQLFGYEHTEANENMTGFEDDSEARMKNKGAEVSAKAKAKAAEKKAAGQKKAEQAKAKAEEVKTDVQTKVEEVKE